MAGDETYIKVKGEWKYLIGLSIHGNTLDFMLSAAWDAPAAEQFFRKAMNALQPEATSH